MPVEVLGINNLLTRFAGCSKPVPDDPIRGYVDADDRRGLLRDVSDAVTGQHIDILAVNTLSDCSTETARMSFVVESESAEQLDRTIRHTTSVPAVLRASRKR